MRGLGALAALALLAGCASHVEPEELLAQIDAGNPPLIIDVRSEAEYGDGHIPGALHVPFWKLAANLDAVPADAETVVLYCEHGPRAGIARAQLWFAEPANVAYLDGHMSAWRERGLPTEPTNPEDEDGTAAP